jgi:hypothetical protein
MEEYQLYAMIATACFTFINAVGTCIRAYIAHKDHVIRYTELKIEKHKEQKES